MHRRIFYDDNMGVDEALDETAFGSGLVARGQHYLTYGVHDKQYAVEKLLAQRKLIRSQYFFTIMQNVMSYDELLKINLLEVIKYQGLQKSFFFFVIAFCVCNRY